MSLSEQTDLLGHPTGPDQGSLFGDGENRMQPPVRATVPMPDRARARLTALLAQVRKAEAMPWPEREARMWRTVFPQMANWLPDEEADQLRLAFDREMSRLQSAG